MTNHPNRSRKAQERNARFVFLMEVIFTRCTSRAMEHEAIRDLQDLPADAQKDLLAVLERVHNRKGIINEHH